MNGRRRVRGWGASGCSNLTWSGRARDVTRVPGGASPIGLNSMNLVVRVHGGAST